jgi:hypothetical protein
MDDGAAPTAGPVVLYDPPQRDVHAIDLCSARSAARASRAQG